MAVNAATAAYVHPIILGTGDFLPILLHLDAFFERNFYLQQCTNEQVKRCRKEVASQSLLTLLHAMSFDEGLDASPGISRGFGIVG